MVADVSFRALGVPGELCARLDADGVVAPFAIQSEVIPPALAGRDVVARAPTGSGKSLAFALPLAALATPARPGRPGGLVLAPTRELAEQLAGVLRPLLRARGLEVVAVYGGVGHAPQRRALAAGAAVVVGCPGRLEDLIAMGALRLDAVERVVIDEADRLADMGFLPVVRRLLGQTASSRQVLMFSATLDGAVADLSRAVQRDPARLAVGPEAPDVRAAQHAFWTVERTDRPEWTARIVRELGSTMVFCRTRHGADRLAKQLTRLGVSAAPIHGGRSQPQRDKALHAFATSAVSALVATDVAARGVHVDDVAVVVHYDAPADPATYVHRSGRTARAGATGMVVAMVEPGTEREARRLQREVGIDVELTAPSLAALRTGVAPPASPVAAPAPPAPAEAPSATATAARPSGRRPAGRRSTPGNGAVAASPADRRRGVVKAFRRDFGFVDIGTGTDLFVHRSNVSGRIGPGDRVELSVREGTRGPEGVDVVGIGATAGGAPGRSRRPDVSRRRASASGSRGRR